MEFKNDKETTKTKANMKQAFARLRGLIRENFDGNSKNQVFVTLTYRGSYERNPSYPWVVQEDFKAFWKRLQRYLPEHKLDYISVVEPHRSGKFHMHVLIKSNQPTLWINKTKLKDIWGRERGNAYIETVKGDDVGSYYVAYFTDLLGDTDKEEKELEINGTQEEKSKKRKKGERIALYPKDMKFYRHSQGIKPPEGKYMRYEEIVKEYGEPVFERTSLIQKDEEELNTIHKATFKKRTYKDSKK